MAVLVLLALATVPHAPPAPMPRAGADVVEDLHAVLATARVDGPYVMVGATLDGLLVRLYSQAYPDEVVGMDLLDAMHEDLVPLFTRLVGSDMIEPIREALADRDDAEGFVVDVLSRRWPTQSARRHL